MSRIYYRGAKAAIVCYGEVIAMALFRVVIGVYNIIDLTDVSSFDRAKFWVNELRASEEASANIRHAQTMCTSQALTEC